MSTAAGLVDDTVEGSDVDTSRRAGKGERTRTAVLDAAIDHFALVGSRSASVPAIARTVGVSSSAVYSYFASKEELFLAAVDADIAALVREALPDVVGGSFTGDFASIFARLLHALEHHALARRVLEGGEAAGAERLAMLPAEVDLQRSIAAALRAGQRNGSVRDDIDPQQHAAGLQAVVIALLMALVQTDGAIDSRYATGAIAVLEAAIRPS